MHLKPGIHPTTYAEHLLKEANWSIGAQFTLPETFVHDGKPKTLTLIHLNDIETTDEFRIDAESIEDITPIHMENYTCDHEAIAAILDGTAKTSSLSVDRSITPILDTIEGMEAVANVLGMKSQLAIFVKWHGQWYNNNMIVIY